MTDFDAEARIDEPSRAAMEAAVELEIDSCIGHITTRGLASKLDKIAAALRAHPAGTQDREAIIEQCAKCVPTTWLDPLLTGPSAVAGLDKFSNLPVERLLLAIANRIRALSVPRAESETP